MICTLQAVDDKLVQIYCVHAECFEGVVQDILSKVALIVRILLQFLII